MRKHLGKKLIAVVAAVVVVGALAAGVAFAAPVLQPGQTSAPGMSGTCTDCHTYAKATSITAPVATPVLFSRPFVKNAKIKRGRTFKVTGYIDPSLSTSATVATVTVSVDRRNSRGRWVAAPSYNQSATVSATGKYAGKLNYVASIKIGRLGKYRLRAKLVYLDASSTSQVKWSKPTNVVVKR
ncbi:MAG: hypothetical protein P4L93_03525 [Coriobacteriia bacterium]|nr:hypothetical protein [Coriobacteriia bacterium]